jgi:cell division protein ZapA
VYFAFEHIITENTKVLMNENFSKNELSIRVNIAERFYPLKINRDDEENIRMAARIINEKVFSFKQRHTDKDMQDWLAMACLFFSFKLIENEKRQDLSTALTGLKNLEQKLTEYLEYAIAKD